MVHTKIIHVSSFETCPFLESQLDLDPSPSAPERQRASMFGVTSVAVAVDLRVDSRVATTTAHALSLVAFVAHRIRDGSRA